MFHHDDWVQKLAPELRNQSNEDAGRRYRLIVELTVVGTDQVTSMIQACDGTICRKMNMIPSLLVEVPYSSIQELARSKYVKRIWMDSPVKALLDHAVPAIGAPQAWETGHTGRGVTVAILDTGVTPHFDLVVPTNRIKAWTDLVRQKSEPYDDNGHGTHIAGIIAGSGLASRGKYRGIAPETELVAIKVLDQEGNGRVSTVIEGIDWCLRNLSRYHINIINLSIGLPARDSHRFDPLCRAATKAWRNGVVVCIAAGNDGPACGTINTPGINPRIITVGNAHLHSSQNGRHHILNSSSSRGPTPDGFPKPDILAPGTGIVSLSGNDEYRSLTGTSMATAMVSGAAALLIGEDPLLTPNAVKRLLMKRARSLHLHPHAQGAGVLDLTAIFPDPELRNIRKQGKTPASQYTFRIQSGKRLQPSFHADHPGQGGVFHANRPGCCQA